MRLVFKLGILVLVLVIGAWLVNRSGWLVVKTINISVADKSLPLDDIQTVVAANCQGKNLLTLDTNQLVRVIKSNFLVVREVRVRRRLPGRLELMVTKRQPAVFLERPTQDYAGYLLDEEGFVLALSESIFGYPVLGNYRGEMYCGSFTEDDNLKQAVDLALKLADRWGDLEHRLTFTGGGSAEVEFGLPEVETVLVSLERDWETIDRELESIILDLRVSGKKLERLDLRFQRPVIREKGTNAETL